MRDVRQIVMQMTAEGGGEGVERHGGSVVSNKSGGFIGRWCIKCFTRCYYGLEYAERRRLLSTADR